MINKELVSMGWVTAPIKFTSALAALSILASCGGGGTGTSSLTPTSFASKGLQAANLIADYGDAPSTNVTNMPIGEFNYKGVAGFNFGNRSNAYIASNAQALGDVNLQANFTNSTISGSMTNFVDYENTPGVGRVDLRNGVISGNAFAADATGTVTLAGEPLVVQSNLVGGFAGTQAEALIGRMDGTWGGRTFSGLVGATKQ